MKKQKIKYNRLKKPSLIKRTWKVSLYFTIPGIIFNYIFWKFYGMDKAMLSLDLLTMLIITPTVILTIIFFYMSIKYFFKVINLFICIKQTNNHDNEIPMLGYTRINEGQQGVGKTFNLTNDLIYQAAENDRETRLSYYLQYPFRKQLQESIDFKVLEETYNYFENDKNHIPHLMANFDIFYKGKKNYPFSMEYIDQKKRLAEYFVCGVTELANEIPNNMRTVKEGKEDPLNTNLKNHTFSLARQMLELTLITDEQRTGETFLGFRSVVSSNRYLTARKKILRPRLIEWYLRTLEKKILKKGLKTSERLSKWYGFWAELCQDIGFYRFYYLDKESIKDRLKDKEEKTFIISCDFPIKYDNRGKRFEYALYYNSPDYKMPDEEFEKLKKKMDNENKTTKKLTLNI